MQYLLVERWIQRFPLTLPNVIYKKVNVIYWETTSLHTDALTIRRKQSVIQTEELVQESLLQTVGTGKDLLRNFRIVGHHNRHYSRHELKQLCRVCEGSLKSLEQLFTVFANNEHQIANEWIAWLNSWQTGRERCPPSDVQPKDGQTGHQHYENQHYTPNTPTCLENVSTGTDQR